MKLAKGCDGMLVTDGAKKAWKRVFEKHRHPLTNAPFKNHAEVKKQMVEAKPVRGQVDLPKDAKWTTTVHKRKRRFLAVHTKPAFTTHPAFEGDGPTDPKLLKLAKLRDAKCKKQRARKKTWIQELEACEATRTSDGIPDASDLWSMEPRDYVNDFDDRNPFENESASPAPITEDVRVKIAERRNAAITKRAERRRITSPQRDRIRDSRRSALKRRKLKAADANEAMIGDLDNRISILEQECQDSSDDEQIAVWKEMREKRRCMAVDHEKWLLDGAPVEDPTDPTAPPRPSPSGHDSESVNTGIAVQP